IALLTDQILPGDNSKWVPPDPIPNSEVKPFSAHDSVVIHAKVGHRQALIQKALVWFDQTGVFLFGGSFFNLVIFLVSTIFTRMSAKPAVHVFILLLAY